MSSPNGTPSKRARGENGNGSQPSSQQPVTPSRRIRGDSNASQTPSQGAQRTPTRARKLMKRIFLGKQIYNFSFNRKHSNE